MVIQNEKWVVALLEELVRWARFQGVQRAKEVLVALLQGDAQKLMYHLSDGRPSEEIAKAASVSAQTVRNYWRAWFTSGIVAPSKKYKGRFEKVFNLEDIGIPLPKTAGSLAKPEAGASTGNEGVENSGN